MKIGITSNTSQDASDTGDIKWSSFLKRCMSRLLSLSGNMGLRALSNRPMQRFNVEIQPTAFSCVM